MRTRVTAYPTFVLLLLIATGCGDRDPAGETDAAQAAQAQTGDANPEQAALQKPDPRGTYGAGVLLEESTTLQAILAQPESYENRIVQVQATVDAVCPRRGCWIDVSDATGTSVRVKVTDGDIVFPSSAKGHQAVIEGIVERIEMTEEQHRAWKEHDAEERGVPFDPTTVDGPMTTWRLQGLGARIQD